MVGYKLRFKQGAQDRAKIKDEVRKTHKKQKFSSVQKSLAEACTSFSRGCILVCKFDWSTKGLGGRGNSPQAGRERIFDNISQSLRGFGEHLEHREGSWGRADGGR